MWIVMLSLAASAAPPATSIDFAFEPVVASITASDAQLQAYGFAPVGSPFLPAWGVRARHRFDSGLTVGAGMMSAFASHRVDDNLVPTTTTWTRAGWALGHSTPGRLLVEAEAGFASLTHSVGSEVQGGALVYLGPYIHPRGGLVLLSAPQHIELQLGYLLQVPVGAAHQQVLWEEDFRRPVVHGGTLAVQMGLGVDR